MVHEFDWTHEFARKLSPSLRRKMAAMGFPPQAVPRVLQASWQRGRMQAARMRVLVRMDDAGEDTAEELHAIVRRGRGRVSRHFRRFATLAVHASAAGLAEMAQHPQVRYITEDYTVHSLLDVAAPTVGAPRLWNDDLRGSGVTVAIVDTGCYPHPDLVRPKQRLVAFHDLVGRRSKPYDDNGHGTHCAGDVAGNGGKSQGKYRGPAPEAKIVAVKALNRAGSGSASAILDGIDWVVEGRDRLGIRVLSLSLGAPAQGLPADDPLVGAVEAAWRAGIVVCAAAGNEGPHPRTVGTPGLAPSIITVGADDDRNTPDPADDAIAYFSSRGPTLDGRDKPDVAAPGVRITSLRAPRSALAGPSPGSPPGYVTLSGTSMATPITAGVVAQLLQAVPDASPDEVKEALVNTARDLGEGREAQGAGLIDAAAALGWLRDRRAAGTRS